MVMFDVDPVVSSKDERHLTQLAQALDLLKERQVPYRWLTNDSLRTADEIAEALHARGLAVEPSEVSTPAATVARWVSEKTPRATIYLMGSNAARTEMERYGLRVIEEPEEIGYLCDYIVTGAFPGFTHRALGEALQCYQLDAALVAIEREPLVPGTGALPGGGPTAAALEAMFRRAPVYTGGMPNVDWLRLLADDLGVQAEDCLVVGDVRRSPAHVAQTAGMRAVVVGADSHNGEAANTASNAARSAAAEVASLPHYEALISYLADLL